MKIENLLIGIIQISKCLVVVLWQHFVVVLLGQNSDGTERFPIHQANSKNLNNLQVK